MNKCKKIISTSIAVSVLLSCISIGSATANSLIDINKDGVADVKDVTYMQQYLAGYFDDENITDVNSDGRLDVNDVTFLQIQLAKTEVVNMSIEKTSLSLGVGDTYTLKINTNSSYKTEWTTSDSDVVKIISSDTNGAEIRATKVGTSIIAVKQKDKTATCKITVNRSKCIDLSEWNGDVDFSKVKRSGITCVILRAGYGKDDNQEDEKFKEYYRQAKNAGLNVGAYWYSYATTVEAAKAEVKNCMKTIQGMEFDLPVFLDVEEYRQAVLPRRTLTDVISTFCDGIKSNGFESGLYSAKSMLVDSAYPDELSSKYLIWLAAPNNSYDELPSYVDIHQYSWTGKVDGISENVDLNYIYDLSQ